LVVASLWRSYGLAEAATMVGGYLVVRQYTIFAFHMEMGFGGRSETKFWIFYIFPADVVVVPGTSKANPKKQNKKKSACGQCLRRGGGLQQHCIWQLQQPQISEGKDLEEGGKTTRHQASTVLSSPPTSQQ